MYTEALNYNSYKMFVLWTFIIFLDANIFFNNYICTCYSKSSC